MVRQQPIQSDALFVGVTAVYTVIASYYRNHGLHVEKLLAAELALWFTF
jgi:hypothetical protein